LPIRLLIAVSQFTKRLESYGGVTTDHNCRATTPSSCRCKLHDDRSQCWADVNDFSHDFESRQDAIIRQLSENVQGVKQSVSTGNSTCFSMIPRC